MKTPFFIALIVLLISTSLLSQTFEVPKNYKLIEAEDYEPYENDVINGVNWLINTPINQNKTKRTETKAFLIKWLTGSPNVMVTVDSEIITFMDCSDCFIIFMGAWAKNAIETKDYDNKLKGNIAGIESVSLFYKNNKIDLGKIKGIEKYIKLIKKNKLEIFIKNKIKH